MTAPIIVREALAAAGELEPTVRDAGAQFGPNGAFYNALPLITAAGAFGPVAPACQLSSGSASVTGDIAVIGAFSPADEFDGTFVACYQATPPGQYPSGVHRADGEPRDRRQRLCRPGPRLYGQHRRQRHRPERGDGDFTATYSQPDASTLSVTGTSAGIQLQGGTVGRALYDASTSVVSVSSPSPTRITSSLSAVLYTLAIPAAMSARRRRPW